jgi:hypothetical protein
MDFGSKLGNESDAAADVILSLEHLEKITMDNCRMSDEVHAALQAGKSNWKLARFPQVHSE